MKNTCIQTHCDHIVQSSVVRFAEEITMRKRSEKRSRSSFAWKQPRR